MRTYDNHGNLIGEINTSFVYDNNGRRSTVTTNTVYNNGKVAWQDIGVRGSQGEVSQQHVIGGKLLP